MFCCRSIVFIFILYYICCYNVVVLLCLLNCVAFRGVTVNWIQTLKTPFMHRSTLMKMKKV